jgi:hypothetical protein
MGVGDGPLDALGELITRVLAREMSGVYPL